MKCLPRSKIPDARGSILHDCHAEIIALRAFNRYLIDECALLTSLSGSISAVIEPRAGDQITESSPQPFAIRGDAHIHMYCSEAPCGDASMELTMQAQEDSTPWQLPPSTSDVDGEDMSRTVQELEGRGYFSKLGIVRRKPGTDSLFCPSIQFSQTTARSDAPLSLSKSCTDKLTLKQCTSILNAAASVLIAADRAYINTLTIPASQHVPTAAARAFSPDGRMSALKPETIANWPPSYQYQTFRVRTTNLEFSLSRRSGSRGQKMTPSNLTAVYTPHFQETLIGGVLQGRKQGDPQAPSIIARKSMWRAVADVTETIGSPALLENVQKATYGEFKAASLFECRRRAANDVKSVVLKGWTPNCGDEAFGLEAR